ncbi:hypothetical protein OSC52_01405 [Clostridium pasteurianum]|nr:hypothetical protein [Clostridium pasteurianum]UZW14528.1 hypothetical protein OSC52_01405 [Clostridium pasteurianum]
MVSIDQKSLIQTIKIYLSEYRSIFKKRSFVIFVILIEAILAV